LCFGLFSNLENISTTLLDMEFSVSSFTGFNPIIGSVEKVPMVGLIGMLLALFIGLCPSSGVTVHLKNGKKVHGKLLQKTSKFVLLEIDLGQLLVQRKNIRKLVEDPVHEDTYGSGANKVSENSKVKHAGGGESQSQSKPHSGNKHLDPGSIPALPGGIAVREKGLYRNKIEATKEEVKDASSLDPLSNWTVPIQAGRLLDRYTWFYDLDISTQISVSLALLLLLWGGFLLGGRILGVDSISGKRALAATSLWFVLLVGVLLIPNPSLLIIGVLLFLLLVAWFISSRGVLGLGWFHSFVLLVLGGFGLSLVALVVEVSESLISL
jgi:hypothetical protein